MEVTLVPWGSDPFRCSDLASDWLLQNKDRKQQLEDLRETSSQVLEELSRQTRRVNSLDQVTVCLTACLSACLTTCLSVLLPVCSTSSLSV